MNKPYYAVIFSSKRSDMEHKEYEEMANRMVDLAKDQKGFVGIESARGAGLWHHGFLLGIFRGYKKLENQQASTHRHVLLIKQRQEH